MRLEDYQRALVSLSFAEAPALGAFGPLALYRDLVRSRLFAMARQAYRRFWASVGEPACNASYARFLAERPPTSPLIREVIGAFAPFAEGDRALFDRAPGHARSLLRFEAAKWRVAYAPDAAVEARASARGRNDNDPNDLRELDFEGVLVVNPTLELVEVEHAIDERGEAGAHADPHTLLVYRRPHEDDVHWYRGPVLLAELLAAGRTDESSLGELVPRVLAARGQTADEPLLHELAAALAVAVERRVLLGVR